MLNNIAVLFYLSLVASLGELFSAIDGSLLVTIWSKEKLPSFISKTKYPFPLNIENKTSKEHFLLTATLTKQR